MKKYSKNYDLFLSRLKKGERIKVKLSNIGDKALHYGIAYEDDHRYFVNVPALNWRYVELVLARNKYTANFKKEFAKHNLEFKL